jgi:hypothetical protein
MPLARLDLTVHCGANWRLDAVILPAFRCEYERSPLDPSKTCVESADRVLEVVATNRSGSGTRSGPLTAETVVHYRLVLGTNDMP